MKKQYLLLIFSFILIISGYRAAAQSFGGNIYLQGHWLEIGMVPNSSFGTTSAAPGGYHPHGFAGIGEVYDYGHDGWTVGTPAYMGDYTLPGSPFEGWEIQYNGLRNLAYEFGGYTGSCAPCGTLTGGLTTYSNVGGVATGNWAGTDAAGALVIQQSTEIDTQASWVVVTTKFYNTSAAAIPNVYYLRTCDPDNDETWAGGGFFTTNYIQYQNDAQHRVLVTATGNTGAYTRWGLGTKDPRAVAFIYSSWPLSGSVDLANIYNKTYTPADYTLHTYDNGDIGIGLVYYMCSIPAHDSAVISYAYIFGSNSSTFEIDSALPSPALIINDSPIVNNTVNDSVNTCEYPDSTGITIRLAHTDRAWTWTSWSWTPSIGLSSTSGSVVRINFSDLSVPTTYTVTGLDTNYCMRDTQILYFTIIPCHDAHNNRPCIGDSLVIWDHSDTTGATYYWWGPHGFTSTSQYIYMVPSTAADSGLYHVIKTVGTIHDTDSTYVIIHPLPTFILSSNSPLCEGMVDTLTLGALPDSLGETFTWTGPNGFTASIEYPSLPGFVDADTGVYTVTGITAWGCKDSAKIHADMIPRPVPPIITDPSPYCQNNPFIPFTVFHTGTVYWWSAATGGASSTVAPIINTAVPGEYHVWASQTIGSCESLRGTDSVRVIFTPPAPPVTGNTQYCQYIGPLDTLTVHTLSGAIARWYQLPTSGDTSLVELWPNINVAGTYTYYVFQQDSGCESPSTTVIINVHPKPSPPITTPQLYCQFQAPVTLIATPSGTGDFLTWFGPGIASSGTLLTPYPQTNTPGLDSFWVNETTEFGCISEKALDTVRVLPKPVPPGTRDTTYCQTFKAVPLNLQVDSAGRGGGDHLRWYIYGNEIDSIPVPLTNTPGTVTWYVTQTINNCQSDSAAVKVTTIYLPKFAITPSSPWVCQLDSITLAYNGPLLQNSAFLWTIPVGDSFGAGSVKTDSMILVKFDSATRNAFVTLKASDDNGKCFTIDTISIKVVPQPTGVPFTKGDICLGDTTSLSIIEKSSNASDFKWYIDYYTLLGNSSALNVISANSNSGGPFSISWLDTGMHIIKLNSVTEEGCASKSFYDTVHVHMAPDASFDFTYNYNTLCLEDSVYFTANAFNYNNSYVWSPAHSFTNIDKPAAWGKLEQTQSVITLTVTDPFGCVATTSKELEPGTCCTVAFPNAFTPNGDGHDDFFRPLYTGYHNFHIFRIQNRWGQTVYESTNSVQKWDGTFNGVPQDMGVYFYYIKYDCGGRTLELSGDVTLIR